jgi:carboxyl-terminal processing protease
MKIRRIYFGAIVLAVAAFLSFTLISVDKKEVFLTDAITQFLKIRHYEPLAIDDELSERIFNIYLERLDFNKRYLLRSDVDKFRKYQDLIDDQIENKEFDFFDLSSDLIHERLLETDEYFEKYLEKPFDLTIDETIDTDPDHNDFAANKSELEEIWRKSLKLQVVARVASNLQTQEEAAKKSDTVKIKPVETLEKEAREAILENYRDWYDRVKQMDREDRQSVYLNSLISAFDPHSVYMPPRDKERFDMNMAGKYEGIGATLRQKQGYLAVVDMFPGSPSWKSKKMDVGDIIMHVAQGDEPAVDILDMKMEKAVELIKGPKGTKVRLTIKKVNGNIEEISLTRDVVIMEETYASSLILKENESQNKKIGYISLPKFYLDFTDKDGRHCSDDVKKELEKLKKDGVDGVIIDLRNNGGGSLPEVVKMAGLFIDKGPVVQVKTKMGKPYILDDTDSGSVFDGPLVVMTNYSSASASEIFAAAIQDYNRGVIVGSPSTFGKGTVQRVTDLDDFMPVKLNDLKPFGALSLTVQKYYRINGRTTQLKGVIPDIILPDSYQYLDIGEKDQEYALSWDEIDPVKHDNWHAPYNLDALEKKSEGRVSKSKDFKLIEENAIRLKENSDRTVFPLNIDKYLALLEEQSREAKKFENLMKDPTGIVLTSLPSDAQILESDTAKAERTERMIEDLGKDIYLSEAVKVMSDIFN